MGTSDPLRGVPMARMLEALSIVTPLCLAVAQPAPACPFCSENQGPTLVGDFAQASMVLYGNFANAKPGADGLSGTTDFVIEKVVKDHELLKGVKGKTITLPRHVAFAKNKFLVFIDVYKGALDPYRGVEVQPGSDILSYLEGAVKLEKAPAAERLRYCFDYLQS